MIEETLKRKKDGGGGAPVSLPLVASDKESKELIDDLRKRNVALKKKVSFYACPVRLADPSTDPPSYTHIHTHSHMTRLFSLRHN